MLAAQPAPPPDRRAARDASCDDDDASDYAERRSGSESPTCSGGSGGSSSGVRPRSSSRVGQYDVGEQLGAGRYSTVRKATDRRTGATVALKRVQIFSIMDSKARGDCVNEVRALQALQHPNIVRYADSFLEDNELVIVLEWADAGDLQNLISRHKAAGEPLPDRTLWAVLRQAAAGLAHMHERRSMHRDLKPSNVFLGSDGAVKLGDLGLSRVMSSKTMELQSMVGTPYYMSPECIRGRPYGVASDVWSLGCLAYEMAALRSPFDRPGLNYYTLGRAIVNCDYERLPAHQMAVGSFVARCLHADPSQRASAAELHQMAAAMEAQIAAGVQQAPPMPMAAGFGCAGQPCAMETVEAATAAPM